VVDLVVDSSVVISGLIVEDLNHEKASRFFATVVGRGDTAWTAATVLWDVAARFVHPQKLKPGATVSKEHNVALRFIDVTTELFYQNQASTHLRLVGNALCVVRSAIKGPDHVFLSCALAKRAPLVTWDRTVRKQADKFGVAVITPEDYVAGKPIGVTVPVPDDAAVLAKFAKLFTRRQ